MIQLKYIPGLLMLLVIMSFKLPEASERQISKELNKYFIKKDYSLKELSVADKYKIQGKFYEIIAGKGNAVVPKYVYAGRVNTMRSSASTGNTGESAEYFDYFIVYDSNARIMQVKITSYQSSHGEMISSPGWLKKFAGYSAGKPLEIGRQVDAISGATISVNNITFDIRQKTHLLTEMVR